MNVSIESLEPRCLMSTAVTMRADPVLIGDDRVQIAVDLTKLKFDLRQARAIAVIDRRMIISLTHQAHVTLHVDLQAVRRAASSDLLTAAISRLQDDQVQFSANLALTRKTNVAREAAIATTIAQDRAALRVDHQKLSHDLHSRDT